MTQSEMLKKIQDSNGRIMNIVFIKRDGTRRSMNCRLGVRKGVTGKGIKGFLIDNAGMLLQSLSPTVEIDTITLIDGEEY